MKREDVLQNLIEERAKFYKLHKKEPDYLIVSQDVWFGCLADLKDFICFEELPKITMFNGMQVKFVDGEDFLIVGDNYEKSN